MTFSVLQGDPDTVCIAIQAIIDLGNEIRSLKITKNNSAYLVGYANPTPTSVDRILAEDGSAITTESGDHIVIE